MRKNIQEQPYTSKKPFIFFTAVSLFLLILPLRGFVSSVKAVLSYVFIPQIRASHMTVEYLSDVGDTVKELLEAHSENMRLKEEVKSARLIEQEAFSAAAENERLASALSITPPKKWTGVWARTAYRDPSRWTSIIIDKGAAYGVKAKSAVMGFDGKNTGLVGTVIEEGENTSKVLLLGDEEFSAVASLPGVTADGLITGSPSGELKLKYIPLGTDIKEGEAVFTSKNSAIFPEGIQIGTVTRVDKGEDFKTYITASVTPAVRPGAVKEVFVFTDKK
ncbi:MAG: rod shape-determining protein MreC [Elusimicrobium sp.]|jgi:rod shape-determining protein MreC|nr:rod shape-determining protein MreC [Elusimicrobium sp.]